MLIEPTEFTINSDCDGMYSFNLGSFQDFYRSKRKLNGFLSFDHAKTMHCLFVNTRFEEGQSLRNTMADVVLIAINSDDIASTNQAKYLMELLQWERRADVETHPSYEVKNVRLWYLPSRILWEDHLDVRWKDATGEDVAEVIFPSRHAAKSGKPCLTLHPIGVPHHPLEEEPPFGCLLYTSPSPRDA